MSEKKSEIRYELYATINGVKTHQNDFVSENEVIQNALSLIESNKFEVALSRKKEAVQVIRVRKIASKPALEKTVFSVDITDEKPHNYKIVAIENAEPIDKVEDLYTIYGRRTLGRILREFLNAHTVTALEFLYCRGLQAQMLRDKEFVRNAVNHLAKITFRRSGLNREESVKKVESLLRDLLRETKKAESLFPHYVTLKQAGFIEMLSSIRSNMPIGEQDFAVRSALANYLNDEDDWIRKVERICRLFSPKLDIRGIEYLDGILAEIFDSTEAVDNLFGARPDLLSVMDAFAGLLNEHFETQEDDPNCLINLANILNQHNLPLTRQIILERMLNTIGSTDDISRSEFDITAQRFILLALKLLNENGIVGEEDMAVALTKRARLVFSKKREDQRFRKAVGQMTKIFPTSNLKIAYLIELLYSRQGLDCKKDIVKRLTNLIENWKQEDEIKSLTLPVYTNISKIERAGLPEILARAMINIFKDLQKCRETTAKETTKTKLKTPESGQKFTKRQIADKEFIFKEGEMGTQAYLISEGEVEIIKGNPEDKRDQQVLAVLGKGEIFGEMSIFDDKPRMASAKAKGDCSLTVIPKSKFRSRLENLAEADAILYRLFMVMMKRLRSTADLETGKK